VAALVPSSSPEQAHKVFDMGIGVVEQMPWTTRLPDGGMVLPAVLSARVTGDIIQYDVTCVTPGVKQVSTPLLKTKLYVPPIRSELVPRPRLIERLAMAKPRCLVNGPRIVSCVRV
jgi:hypothetical protein